MKAVVLINTINYLLKKNYKIKQYLSKKTL